MKHNCKCCNYSTDKLFNYKTHLKSKRHLAALDKSSKKVESTKKPTPLECEYCGKSVSYKRHLSRHHSICEEKKIQEKVQQAEKSKNDIIREKDKQIAEMKQNEQLLLRQLNQLQQKLREAYRRQVYGSIYPDTIYS